MEAKYYFLLFVRRLHWFILVLVLSSAIGLLLAYALPTVYQAEARLLVESEQIPDELAASTVRTQATEQLEIIEQRILTRDKLVEISNKLDIYATRAREGKPPLGAAEIVADLKKRISIKVTGSASRSRQAQATIVSVSFEAPTAQLSAAVTNELVTLILGEDVSMRTRIARQTLEFFEQEVQRLDRELAQKATSILQFKEQNMAALPDSLDFRRNKQAAAQERLLLAERSEGDLRERRERMVRLHSISRNAQGLPPLIPESEDERQLLAMKKERIKLLSVLSEDNPKVKLVDAQIATLEKLIAEQRGLNVSSEEGQPMSAYELQLADLDAQIEIVVEQKKVIQDEINDLTDSIAATPSNAITLEALERDYAAVQAQYNQAVSNKAKAETGDTIEALSKGQRISVIEQAVAPNKPKSPNRPLIAAGGVGAGVFLGVALIALFELLGTKVRRPADLVNSLGITPFATLPYLRTRGEILRRRLLIWGSLMAFFAACAAGLWAVHTYYIPLEVLVERLRDYIR